MRQKKVNTNMRLATVKEILAKFDAIEVFKITGKDSRTISHWRWKNKMPEKWLIRFALAYPEQLVVDDEGYPYWIEASSFVPPDWIPMRWWDVYLHVRQRNNMGVDMDHLQHCVDALERIRDDGYEIDLALRHAATRQLRTPVAVTRTT